MSELQRILDNNLAIRESIMGIAVKLSVLEQFNIDIRWLLDTTRQTILIDAEYRRLDSWIDECLRSGKLTDSDLQRIIITVQARRSDALDQIAYLKSRDISVLLVGGNAAYLTDAENERVISSSISEIVTIHKDVMLGISAKIRVKIQNKTGIVFDNSQILELLGYQSLRGSMMWTYLGQTHLSDAAESYLDRRSGNDNQDNRYIIQDMTELLKLGKHHQLFLYVDAMNARNYKSRINILSQ